MKNRAAWAALAGLAAAGFLLRVWNLSDYALNPDEVIFASTAAEPTVGEVWRSSLANAHPPANFFLLHFMLKVSSGALWLRSASLAAGVAAIVALFLFARELGGPAAGLAAAALAAFSPNLAELSGTCRNYMPGIALLGFALFFLARWMREPSMRGLAFFGLFQFLAAAWVYSFVAVFIAAGLALGGTLLARRASARDWAAAALAELPAAALMLFFYFTHIRAMNEGMVGWMREIMGQDFAVSPRAFLSPFIQSARYLVGGEAIGKIACYLALAALPWLAARRRWRELALLAGPLAVAYCFALAGMLPLGGSRHSAHLHLFFFAILGLLAAELAYAAEVADAAADKRIRPWGAGAVALVMLLYMGWAARATATGGARTNQPEHPTVRAELRAAWDFFTRERRPEDRAVVSYQAALVLRHELAGELARYEPWEPSAFTIDGAELRYSPAGGWILDHASFLRAADEAAREAGSAEGARIWAIRVAEEPWEPFLARDFRREYPNEPFDESIVSAGAGRLFALGAEAVRRLAAELPPREDDPNYRRDFIRSQTRPPMEAREPR